MEGRNAKRVVILNDVCSDTIEQAILILRGGNVTPTASLGESGLVREAEKMIRRYAGAMEKTRASFERSERKRRRVGQGGRVSRRIGFVCLALFGFVTAAGLLYRFWDKILALF